jgi:16S rRNA processing protein RimM
MTAVVVGRIIKAHGIKGEVMVDVLSDVPGRFAPGAHVAHGDRELTVATSRAHQGRMLVRFEGIADRNGAEALRGVELSVDSALSPPPPDGSWYTHQLIGCDVIDEKGVRLGALVRIEETAANDLWVVADGAREVLVPAVRAIVSSVDVEARRVVLTPPEGLFGS